jgi:hypothetical protein
MAGRTCRTTTRSPRPVQDAEVPPGVPGAVRLDPGRPSALSRLLPLVQHRAPSCRARPVDARRRAPRPGRAAHRSARDRARHGLHGASRAVLCGPSGPGGDADRGLDQSPQAQRARGGGAYSLNSRPDCLNLVDRFRPAKSQALSTRNSKISTKASFRSRHLLLRNRT